MKRLTLNSVKKNNETSVSNIFLDTFMCSANGEFVKVYLYLLRCIDAPDGDITMSDIADKLNLTEKDVIRALKYWAGVQVLDVTFDKETGEASSVTILPLEDTESNTTISDPEPVADKVTHSVAPRSYSSAKIKRLKEQEDVKELLYIVEKYLGKELNQTDAGVICYIYNELHFSIELIEYLVDYCVNNGHRSTHYIEKVALEWHDKGITTVSQAKDDSAIYNKRVYTVTRTFGLKGRDITPIELDFINRWYDDFGFDKEMVEEACKRTILSVNRPNFSYAESILKKWKQARVYTLEDLKTLDAGFRAKITIPVTANTAQTSQPTKTTNRFNNFNQRTYNFEELEKKLIRNN